MTAPKPCEHIRATVDRLRSDGIDVSAETSEWVVVSCRRCRVTVPLRLESEHLFATKRTA